MDSDQIDIILMVFTLYSLLKYLITNVEYYNTYMTV